ncbi:recombinase family protein [Amycolatopsis taiwanensis]|uniref:recombinase family protein n=1 Tax=Amycolatopsis taiwanensis TaxID=342230 RepID=UPI000486F96A|nr:recombinase family protein [Amycolatopsis taiwanensis]
MTIFGYVRVTPHAPAGTADMQSWWMKFLGCQEVFADVWQGPHHPPAFDRLLDHAQPGDAVVVPLLSVFGPTDAHVREARKRLGRQGVTVVLLGEQPPVYQSDPLEELAS